MTTTRLTMAQALVKFLDNQYIEVDGVQSKFVAGVFTIFGHGNVLGLGQALEQDSGDLVVHQGRNEQGMAHAAIGFAKQHLRRKIYACSSSVGPGAANMLTAAATATANRIPLLLLPGDVYASRQPDPVLQQIEQFHDLSISTNDAFKAVSKYWDRINRPEQLMTAAIHAMRVLTDPAETGAVTLALPQDVQAEAYDYPDYFLQKRVHRIDRRPATEAMLGDALALLKGKRQPLIICGGGVRYAGANAALQAFAERFDIPFAETQAGKSAVVSSHPLNVGGVGETGCLAANLLAKKADLIIGIGTRYSDFTGIEMAVPAPGCTVPQPQHQPVRCVEARRRAIAGGRPFGTGGIVRCDGRLSRRMGRADRRCQGPAGRGSGPDLSGGFPGRGFCPGNQRSHGPGGISRIHRTHRFLPDPEPRARHPQPDPGG